LTRGYGREGKGISQEQKTEIRNSRKMLQKLKTGMEPPKIGPVLWETGLALCAMRAPEFLLI
jgi:hypothetical protein